MKRSITARAEREADSAYYRPTLGCSMRHDRLECPVSRALARVGRWSDHPFMRLAQETLDAGIVQHLQQNVFRLVERSLSILPELIARGMDAGVDSIAHRLARANERPDTRGHLVDDTLHAHRQAVVRQRPPVVLEPSLLGELDRSRDLHLGLVCRSCLHVGHEIHFHSLASLRGRSDWTYDFTGCKIVVVIISYSLDYVYTLLPLSFFVSIRSACRYGHCVKRE